MNEDKITEYLFEIKTQLAEISANQKNFQQILTNHENRIMNLEKQDKDKPYSFKDEIVKMIVKALVISVTTVGALCGAGALIQKTGVLQ